MKGVSSLFAAVWTKRVQLKPQGTPPFEWLIFSPLLLVMPITDSKKEVRRQTVKCFTLSRPLPGSIGREACPGGLEKHGRSGKDR
jgi:hypothetical protein